MQCRNCGAKIEHEQKFCTVCGARVEVTDAAGAEEDIQSLQQEEILQKEVQVSRTEKAPGNLLTMIPGVFICVLTAAFVFLMVIASPLLLPETQREELQKKFHVYEITGFFLGMSEEEQRQALEEKE